MQTKPNCPTETLKNMSLPMSPVSDSILQREFRFFFSSSFLRSLCGISPCYLILYLLATRFHSPFEARATQLNVACNEAKKKAKQNKTKRLLLATRGREKSVCIHAMLREFPSRRFSPASSSLLPQRTLLLGLSTIIIWKIFSPTSGM